LFVPPAVEKQIGCTQLKLKMVAYSNSKTMPITHNFRCRINTI
jgi:hypothetical protein